MQMIGIDLGTTYIKGGILDLDAHTIERVIRRPFPAPPASLPALHHEVDAEPVIEATSTLVLELARHAPHATGILVSSQMHGFLLAEPSDAHGPGAPLTRLITWQDQRALEPLTTATATSNAPAPTAFTALQDRLTQDDLLALGNGLKASLPLCALYTLKLQSRLPPQAAVLWSLSDYVLARIDAASRAGKHDGGNVAANSAYTSCMEPTIAASMGMYDFSTGDWGNSLLKQLDLQTLTLPTIVPYTTPMGAIRVDGRELPIYPALGDHQCATLGSLLRPHELALNISTGSQVSLLADEWRANAAYETRPYFGDRVLNTVTRVPAGRALSALMHLLTDIPRHQGHTLENPWETIGVAVEAVPSTDLAVNLSFFASPFGETGAITGVHEGNLTVGHLFRAAFVHMAENYAQCADWLQWQPQAGQPRRLVFAGGLAQNFPALRDEITARLRAEQRISPSPEDTLLGLLALGMVITQTAPTLDLAVARLAQTMKS